jgi:hypothetical protein
LQEGSLTFSVKINPLVDDGVVITELIVLEDVECIESGDISHVILSDILSERDRIQASLDIGWLVV